MENSQNVLESYNDWKNIENFIVFLKKTQIGYVCFSMIIAKLVLSTDF